MTGSIEVDYQPQPIFTKHIEQPPFKYTFNRLEHRAVDNYALKMGLLIRAGSAWHLSVQNHAPELRKR